MFGIETANRACKILKGQRSEKVTTHFCLRAFRLKLNPGLLPCLVSQLAPLAELHVHMYVKKKNLPSFFFLSLQRPTPLSVIDLIKQSNECFSFISNQTIDNMRNTALLDVGQNLQESSRRSLLRATMENSKFTRKELEVLYQWFEVCCYTCMYNMHVKYLILHSMCVS